MKRFVSVVFVLICGLTLIASVRSDYASIKKKFEGIEREKLKPGTRVPLTAAELNAYVQMELPKVAPAGVSRPVVRLHGNNVATGSATVDFVRLRSAQGKPPNWFLRTLLAGEHDLSVTARVKSGGGNATVDLERVEIEGVQISGAALDFLIQNYLIPNYPNAKIGKPFALNYKIDRLEVTPQAAFVVTR